jgi:hypothetical protein
MEAKESITLEGPKPVEFGMDRIDTNIDLELLAALADGRLSGDERDRALKMLASSDDALEIFANTVREQPHGGAVVVPITTARRWRQWKVIVPIAAAAAIAFLAVPKLLGPGGRVVPANQYATQLASDPRFAGALRGGWEERGWAVNRGGGVTTGTAAVGSDVESRLAFRLGVRTVDLMVALRGADSVLAARLIGEIMETLKSVELSQAIVARYAELKAQLPSDSPAHLIARASDVEQQLRDLLRSPSFLLGQWAGAADIAAQAGEASFFNSSLGTRFVKSAIPADQLTTIDGDALREIDSRLSQGGDKAVFDDVHAILQKFIRRRGS